MDGGAGDSVMKREGEEDLSWIQDWMDFKRASGPACDMIALKGKGRYDGQSLFTILAEGEGFLDH